LLNAAAFDGPLILHSLSEAQAPFCIDFLKEKLAAQSQNGAGGLPNLDDSLTYSAPSLKQSGGVS
jgi:hypothetical protein